jgi:hypothetical protein
MTVGEQKRGGNVTKLPIITAIAGFIIGLLCYDYFFKPKQASSVQIIETFNTDTLYFFERDTVTVYRDRIKHEFLRDTVIKYYEPKISRFKAVFPLAYGNVYLNGDVLGEVLKMTAKSDFEMPVITNTITKDRITTIIKKPTGFYSVGGVTSDLSAIIGGTYLKDKSLYGYKYNVNLKTHSIEYGHKIF